MKMIFFVGEFFLTKSFEEYEDKQVNLVRNVSWFDYKKLEGFTSEVREILESNKLLSADRINKIVKQIEDRIKYIKDFVESKNNS